MNREKQCHTKNGTFGEEWHQSSPCPKPIPAGWVFKIKHRGNPIDEKDLLPKQFKARVIRGQFMKEGLDFNDTFAPVAKPGTIRAMFAIDTKHGCKLKAGDVETAFLTADMDCDVWVKMPTFWGHGNEDITGERKELPPRRLLKGVPGIPQGSRLFYDTFAEHLATMGWKPATADKCLFLNSTAEERTAVILWVDDFIFMHEKDGTWSEFIDRLRARFTIPTVGELSTFLGMDISYNLAARTMSISQANTIATLLERDCNPAPTPCQAGAVFSKQDCPKIPDAQDCTEYRKLIALANFVMSGRVNKLCKYMSNPGPVHWQALKHLLRYLKGSARSGLFYNFGQPSPVPGLHGFTDASYADCPDTSKSTIGYVFFYDGAILSWYSKLHIFVTTCTNHSEYAALAHGAKEAQWMVYLFNEVEPHAKHTPVPVFVDNSGVISMCSTLLTTSQTSTSASAVTTLVSSRTRVLLPLSVWPRRKIWLISSRNHWEVFRSKRLWDAM
jgi:histone deacetylase 1/2